MLSAAPVAVDDAYDLGPDGRIAVDVTIPSPIPEAPLPPPPAFDETRWVEPTGPWTTPDFVKTIEGGQVVTEPDWVELGETPGSYGEVTIRDPGSRWVVSNWLEVAEHGKGTVSVSDGGTLDTRNWTAIGTNTGSGDGGLGSVTVTGPNSRWVSTEYVQVGYGRSWGSLRLQGGARMTTGTPAEHDHTGSLDIGANGGRGVVEILGGSTAQTGQWMQVASGGGRGILRIADGSALHNTNWASVATTGGYGTVTVNGALSRWNVDNFLSIAENGGKAIVRVEDGARLNVGNWVEIGEHRGSDGRLFLTGAGSQFTTASSWIEIGAQGAGTLYTDPGTTATVAGGSGVLYNLTGGRILGSGTVRATVENTGFISPGGSTGVLTLSGHRFEQSGPTGTLHFDIGGTQRGTQYDGLNIPGLVEANGGKIVLNFVNGFAPSAGQQFTLIDGGLWQGAVTSNVEVRGLAPGFQYTLAVENNDLVLVATGDATSAPVTVQRKGVLANDIDADADRLTAILVDRPDHGTVTLFSDGSFTYVAGPTFTGTDTFQYKADDGLYESNVATVTLRRPTPPPNEAPVARPDHKATRQGRALSFPASDLTANDSDPDRGDTLTVTAVSATDDTHGTVTLRDGTVTYTPDRNFRGGASFTYTVSDGHGGTATGTVNVTVQGRQRGTAGTAVGRGSLNDRRRTFSFMISSRVTGKGDEVLIRGTLSYADKQAKLDLRAVDFTLFELDRVAKKATVAGTATVNGRPGYRFEATLEDRSASGSNDRFRIKIAGPEDFAYDSNTGSRNGDRIDRGGSIVLTDAKGPITAAPRA